MSLYSNYGQINQLCENPITSILSNKKYIFPTNSSIYYGGECFYTRELAPNIESPEVMVNKPEELKGFFKDKNSKSWRHEDKKIKENSAYPEAAFFEKYRGKRKTRKRNSCKSCSGVRENYEPKKKMNLVDMDGYNPIKLGSKTVVGCAKCYKGGDKIPGVTSVDTHNKIMKGEILKNPQSCNYQNDWEGSRYRSKNIVPLDGLSHNYESVNNLNWGPKFWEFLDMIAFSYPDNPSDSQKKRVLNFLLSLPFNTPRCDNCYEYMSKYPPAIHSKSTLTRWLVDFHNFINRQLGKPELDYNQVRNKYSYVNIITPGGD